MTLEECEKKVKSDFPQGMEVAIGSEKTQEGNIIVHAKTQSFSIGKDCVPYHKAHAIEKMFFYKDGHSDIERWIVLECNDMQYASVDNARSYALDKVKQDDYIKSQRESVRVLSKKGDFRAVKGAVDIEPRVLTNEPLNGVYKPLERWTRSAILDAINTHIDDLNFIVKDLERLNLSDLKEVCLYKYATRHIDNVDLYGIRSPRDIYERLKKKKK